MPRTMTCVRGRRSQVGKMLPMWSLGLCLPGPWLSAATARIAPADARLPPRGPRGLSLWHISCSTSTELVRQLASRSPPGGGGLCPRRGPRVPPVGLGGERPEGEEPDTSSTDQPSPDQGKPLERVGRKATGLRPARAGYGRRAAGRTQHLLMGCAAHTALPQSTAHERRCRATSAARAPPLRRSV
jgi:hypothetical protein